jgi:hypothetical protein
MGTKTERLEMRMSPDVKEALKRAAEDDARSQGSLIEKILRDWLSEHGYLPQSKQAKKKR